MDFVEMDKKFTFMNGRKFFVSVGSAYLATAASANQPQAHTFAQPMAIHRTMAIPLSNQAAVLCNRNLSESPCNASQPTIPAQAAYLHLYNKSQYVR